MASSVPMVSASAPARRYAKSCALSGRNSSQVTTPPVKRSIDTHRSTGTTRGPLTHCEINTGDMPMLVAKDAPRPRSPLSHSLSFMLSILARCQVNAIAQYELGKLAKRYLIKQMKTIGEIRRDNLLLLLDEYKSLANLNDQLGMTRTDATLSQIKNKNMTHRGEPKMMGTALARRIELDLKLQGGWMDNDHQPASYRQDRIDQAVLAMEKMADWQLEQAVTIIDTIAIRLPVAEVSLPAPSEAAPASQAVQEPAKISLEELAAKAQKKKAPRLTVAQLRDKRKTKDAS